MSSPAKQDLPGTLVLSEAECDEAPLPPQQVVPLYPGSPNAPPRVLPGEDGNQCPSRQPITRLFQDLQSQHEEKLQSLLQAHRHSIVEAVTQVIVEEIGALSGQFQHQSTKRGVMKAPGKRASGGCIKICRSSTTSNDAIKGRFRASTLDLDNAGRVRASCHSLSAEEPEIDSTTLDDKGKPPAESKAISFAAVSPEDSAVVRIASELSVMSELDDTLSDSADLFTGSSDIGFGRARAKSVWNVKDAGNLLATEQALLKSRGLGSGFGAETPAEVAELLSKSRSPFDLAAALTSTRHFELTTCSVILLNALVIGVTADWAMKNPGAKQPGVFRVFELFFLVFFTIELLLRIFAEKLQFCNFWSNLFRWNVFDSALVVAALAEETMSIAFGSAPDVGAFRVLRMLRIMRVFRVIRVVRFFKELRVMVSGIVNSLYSLMWALILLGCIKYVFAMCVLQFAAIECDDKERDPAGGVLDDEDYEALQKYYGSLVVTIWTLFQSICGGIDWGDAAEPLLRLHWGLAILFALYIAFAVLCVLNIVTGVFVENANQMTSDDQDMVLMEQLESRDKWFEEVRDIFEAADADGSGYVNGEEFTKQIKEDVRLQAQFRKIGVHVEAYSASGLFQLLDFDGDGELDLDEFCLALQQVHGTARSIDVAKLTHDTRVLRRTLSELTELCSDSFAALSKKLGPNR